MDPLSLASKGPLQEMWMFAQPAASPGGGVLWMHPAAVIGAGAASVEESTVTGQSGGARGRWNRGGSGTPGTVGYGDESSKLVSTCSGNELIESETQHPRAGGSRDENGESKADVEANSGICNKLTDEGAQHSEAPKQDYIHVRARRGQATDSHSLAERARRGKISERMKILQDLVPGCNKVIGKALVLDEIINYIQSLQRQVEFLSMKLEALSSQMNPSIKGFPAKDFGIQAHYSASGLAFTLQTTEYRQGSSEELLHMQRNEEKLPHTPRQEPQATPSQAPHQRSWLQVGEVLNLSFRQCGSFIVEEE